MNSRMNTPGMETKEDLDFLKQRDGIDLNDKRKLVGSKGRLKAIIEDLPYLSTKYVLAELAKVMARVSEFLTDPKYSEKHHQRCEKILLKIFEMEAFIEQKMENRPATRFFKWCSRIFKAVKAWFLHFGDGFKILREILARLGMLLSKG